MRFVRYLPDAQLKPFIKCYAVSEAEPATEYRVLPATGIVIGFQYAGHLSIIADGAESRLAPVGVTGISDRPRIFKNAAKTGSVLVYFTETGFAHFASHPANELFNLSVSLEGIFDKGEVNRVEEQLALTSNDRQRIAVVERFLRAQLKQRQTDKLIVEAVRLIYESKGSIRIKELIRTLCISQSPFEKRFRKIVGTSPKKFASIVRFNAVLDDMTDTRSLTRLCYENNFFDQAHFIRDFRQFTGVTPEHFRRSL